MNPLTTYNFNGLQTVGNRENAKLTDGSNSRASEELSQVANQFEAIFIENLLKQARESKLSDALFETSANDNFNQMLDAEIAKSSSETVDIGIAEAIIEQMSKSGINK